MDAHRQPMIITRACSEHMHSCCVGVTCGCHQVCARCLMKCQAIYDASEVVGVENLVCATCYVDLTRGVQRHRCEGCGGVNAYRDPALGDAYLCVGCHQQREIHRLAG